MRRHKLVAALTVAALGGALQGRPDAAAAESVFQERHDTFTVSQRTGRSITCTLTSRFTFNDSENRLGVETFAPHGGSWPPECEEGIAHHIVSFTTTDGSRVTFESSGHASTAVTLVENVGGDISTRHYLFLDFCDCSSPTFALPK